MLERLLRRALRGWSVGSLRLTLPSGGTMVHFGATPGPAAEMEIHRWSGVLRMFSGGDIGFAEGYLDGDWSTSDLDALLSWAMANEQALTSVWRGSPVSRLLSRMKHRLRDNSRRNSRRNIAAHYDLGNAFYETWLDPSMTYSSALYGEGEQSLEAAQQAKIDRVTEALDLKGGEHVLEIGCGWGALAAHLATVRKCHVTGLTLSQEQLAYARQRLEQANVATWTDLRLQDYRDVQGTFDRVVSIEMMEAVGARFWPLYLTKMHDVLRQGGKAVVQVITIDEARFDAYRARPDFIQSYIFPGGMLPTDAIVRAEAQQAGLAVIASETFGASYARTLAEWRRRFHRAWPQIAAQGFDERFRRMWDYYLVYCEVGFRLGIIDVGLYTLQRR